MINADKQWQVDAVFLQIHRKQAYRQQRGRCFWCGIEMEKNGKRHGQPLRPNHCTTDHVIPTAKGGRDHPDNIVAACNRCNNERGDRPADQWVLLLARRVPKQQVADVLQKLTKFGISVAIGHPEQSAPMQSTPDCPPRKETEPAP
jgi:hypothetical protein